MMTHDCIQRPKQRMTKLYCTLQYMKEEGKKIFAKFCSGTDVEERTLVTTGFVNSGSCFTQGVYILSKWDTWMCVTNSNE